MACSRFRDLPGLLPIPKQRHASHNDVTARDNAHASLRKVHVLALAVVEIYRSTFLVERHVHRPFIFFTAVECDGDAAAGRRRLGRIGGHGLGQRPRTDGAQQQRRPPGVVVATITRGCEDFGTRRY